MKLKFYARRDLLVTKPGFVPRFSGGDVPRYVGRKFVPRDGDKPAHHVATKEPAEFDSDSEAGQKLMTMLRQDCAVSANAMSLWPADAETAATCGVPFAPVQFVDGEWIPKPIEAPKRAKSE